MPPLTTLVTFSTTLSSVFVSIISDFLYLQKSPVRLLPWTKKIMVD